MRSTAAIACSLCLLAPAAGADDAQSVFESLYGKRVRAAQASPTRSDDLELAGDILRAARSVNNQPAMLAVLCRNAFELASKTRDGHDVALEALNLLAEGVPEQADAVAEQRVPLLQQAYAGARGEQRTAVGAQLIDNLIAAARAREKADDWAGAQSHYRRATSVAIQIRSDRRDAIKAAMDRSSHRQRVTRRIEQLKAALRDDPQDTDAARRLIDHLILDMDDLTAARKYAFLLDDEALKNNISRANRSLDALESEDAIALGDWYRQLAARAPSLTEPGLWRRSAAYYDRFLELHESEDLLRTKAELARQEIERKLQSFGPALQATTTATVDPTEPAIDFSDRGGGRTAELLKLLNLSRHRLTGKTEDCRRDGMTFFIRNGNGGGTPRVALPVAPRGSYELKIQYAHGEKEKGALAVYLPAGEGAVAVFVHENGEAWMGNVDGGRHPGEKRSARFSPPPEGKPWELIIRVAVKGKGAAIAVATPGSTDALEWTGAQTSLKTFPWVHKLKCPGIGVDGHPTRVITSVKLRMLSGQLGLLKDEAFQTLTEEDVDD